MKPYVGLFAVASCVALSMASPALAASLDTPASFNIPAQPLDSALLAYSRQSGIQIISDTAVVARRMAPELKATETPRRALSELLKGSNLSFVVTGANTVAIVHGASAQVERGAAPATQPVATAPQAAVVSQPAVEAVGEIVVTATRQASTVSKVPLSISAVTQKSLDQQGIKSVADLARTVPSLTISGQQGGLNTYAIRGIVSTQGAATTGVYLDDTPLQKRNVAGANFLAVANGTPGPALFDLERIEVLRGPQGTLYGGSSQGGTVRFITPQPSLTKFSTYARAEVSSTDYGDPSYEAGVAVGGPIVNDKLGFRVSVYDHHVGGYIDYLDPYRNGAVRYRNANTLDTQAVRAAMTWAPLDDTRVTLAYYGSLDRDQGGGSSFNPALNQTLTTPQRCFNPNGATAVARTTDVPCSTPGAFVRPAQTYGPFGYVGPYQVFSLREKSPATTRLDVGTLTVDQNIGRFSLKSITSYLYDQTDNINSNEDSQTSQQYTTLTPGAGRFPLLAQWPDYMGQFINSSRRSGIMEEVRLSSPADDRPLSWVAGVYVSRIQAHSTYHLKSDVNRTTQILFGINDVQRFGFAEGSDGISSFRDQSLVDEELAGFGEANYYVTDKFKLIAGVRVSRVEFKYNQTLYGILNGWATPTEANTGLVKGSSVETPVTPKFGFQYQLNATDMVYATAAKGYRASGVNSPLSSTCAAGLASVGLTLSDVPKTYGSDMVWSYEAGAKFRLLDNRLQVNSSVFMIDWSGVQLNVATPGCFQTYVANAGSARSSGFDLQVQGRLAGGLTGNVAIGYNNAEYTQTATGPKPLSGAPATAIVQKGDKLPVPPWTLSVGLQYDFRILGGRDAYVRGDYQYTSEYYRSLGPGVPSYSPDTRNAPQTQYLSARAGVAVNRWDFNVFVKNLTESRDELNRIGGRSGCPISQGAACTGFTNFQPFYLISTFRPREIGVQASYRF